MKFGISILIPSVFLIGCARPSDEVASADTAVASESALSTSWQGLLTCDLGAAVLDVNGDERRNMQFVIRDANIIRYLNGVGAVSSHYGDAEIMLSGWTGRVDWAHSLGPRVNEQPYGGVGVFNAGDFNEFIAGHNYYDGPFGWFSRIAREGAGIKVQFGTIEKRGCAQTQTTYIGDGFGWVTECAADYSAFVEKANWYFRDCR